MLRVTNAGNFRRTLSGLCLIAAPLVLLVAMIVHGGGGNAGLVKTMIESPGRVQAANLLIMFSTVLFVPALVGLLGLVRGRGVVLAHAGVALAIIGVIGHAVWAGFQIVLLGLVQSGAVDRADVGADLRRPARAGTCAVRLACPNGRTLDIEVTEDGVGMTESPEFGVGRRSMQERATELGGSCRIENATPAGTRIFARLPLAEPAELGEA